MTIFFTIFGFLCIVGVWVILYDTNRFVVSRITYTNEKLKKASRVVVLSDLHNKQYGKENQVLLEAIREAKPDKILIAGDMITAKPGRSMKKTLGFLEALAKEYPVYYGNGNHEQRLKLYPEVYKSMEQELSQALKQCGICVLPNTHVDLLEEGMSIYGLELERVYYNRRKVPAMEVEYLEQELGKSSSTNCTVLLAHNPDYFETYSDWGADLVLSGHVHGGIARVPVWNKGVISPSIRLFPKYDGGIFRHKQSTMILSRGLGVHTIPVRAFNPGELIVLDMFPEAEKTEEK